MTDKTKSSVTPIVTQTIPVPESPVDDITCNTPDEVYSTVISLMNSGSGRALSVDSSDSILKLLESQHANETIRDMVTIAYTAIGAIDKAIVALKTGATDFAAEYLLDYCITKKSKREVVAIMKYCDRVITPEELERLL